MPFVPIVKESHQSMSMLGADYAAGASGVPVNRDNPRRRESNAQSIYGNQAVLRMLKHSANSSPLFLQRKCACHGATSSSAQCERCGKEKRSGLQAKLRVSEPGDAYEQEADRVADQVLAAPSHHAVNSTPPRIQRYSGSSTPEINSAPASVGQVLASPGAPLEPALRQDMEQRFGYDFSRVRVHTSAFAEQSAQDVNAHAYTVGQNIVFGAGQFTPGTQRGRRLIAHELTHVVQQGSALNRLQRFAECNPAGLSLEECPAREPGETERAKSGPMTFSSLHVPPTLSGPVSGQGGGLIANFDIGSTVIKPNLAQSLYWKAFLNDIAAHRLEIEILGFSDCENKKGREKEIREGRAAAVFNILPPKVKSQVSSREGAMVADCITENINAADRTLNRSVALLFKNSVVDFEPEEIKVPRRELVCGPDVTSQVAGAVKLTRSLFQGWNAAQREDVCDALISVWKAKCAWDIIQLSPNRRDWIAGRYHPPCAPGDAKTCGESIQIEDDCHFAGSANYVLFGVMFKLCHGADPHWVFDYSKSNMMALIAMYKSDAANYAGSMAWAAAGYDGWPSGASSPHGDRPDCTPICPKKYVGDPFEIHWYPHHREPNWCGLGT